MAVDAHPKHAIALGAAWVASGAVSGAREVRVERRSGSAAASAAAATAEASARVEPTALAEATALVTRPAERTSATPPVADRGAQPAPRPSAEWPEHYATDRTPSRYGDRTPVPPSRYESDRSPSRYAQPPAPRILAAILVGLVVGALVGMGILALLNR